MKPQVGLGCDFRVEYWVQKSGQSNPNRIYIYTYTISTVHLVLIILAFLSYILPFCISISFVHLVLIRTPVATIIKN